jgi:hypothetical protein
MSSSSVEPNAEMQRILESARRLGVELNEQEAIQWMVAVSSQPGQSDIVQDERQGIFGHRITLLDFSPERLAYFRQIGRLVEFHDEPGLVETALALSGSAAQSRIQTYPGDADFFERVNIIAPTRLEACQILGRIMRQKALSTEKGATYQLIEVKYGQFPQAMETARGMQKVGAPVSWSAPEIRAGQIEGKLADGTPHALAWEEAGQNPGWCKLDWVVADPVDQQLVNASNMLDVTWEAPDGSIEPLDGYLDPYFQEVYLESASVPIFTKLAKHVDSNALDDYVSQLEKEVRKYVTKDPNYGKAAKRMYNIFRLTGRYQEAAYLRELFDEPTTVLYQVWSLIRTIDDTFRPGGTIPVDTLLAQADRLILMVINVLEGAKEGEIVRLLLRLRDLLSRERGGQELSPQAEAARAEIINLVNNFFYEKLTGIPEIRTYIDTLAGEQHG